MDMARTQDSRLISHEKCYPYYPYIFPFFYSLPTSRHTSPRVLFPSSSRSSRTLWSLPSTTEFILMSRATKGQRLLQAALGKLHFAPRMPAITEGLADHEDVMQPRAWTIQRSECPRRHVSPRPIQSFALFLQSLLS